MTINEMIKNAKAAIPALDTNLSMSVDELNEAIRNAMIERFVSEVVCDSELCGVSPVDSRQFAVDFIQNNDYVKKYLTAAVNLVLSGAFSEKCQLDSFINRLLWSYVVIASHMFISSRKGYKRFWSLSETERVELQKQAMKQAMLNWNE